MARPSPPTTPPTRQPATPPGIDDTIERRWGAKIKASGIYRDPVRSSHGHFVKASSLRWLSLMVMVPIPWVGRRWALPFLYDATLGLHTSPAGD